MKIVSMVPSWTETLIAANVSVVGRTRFCIHPDVLTKNIPIVGGTKDWSWEKIERLNADLILLDQEENPKFMSEQSKIAWIASNVQTIEDMPSELLKLSTLINSQALKTYADRWSTIKQRPKLHAIPDFSHLPSILEWGRRPEGPITTILYMIWKDPWMTVSHETFIGSLLNKFSVTVPKFSEKYPKINLEDYEPHTTLLLFSSEPYPFLKRKQELAQLPFPHAHVNGESWSWFGIRSLEFLEKHL